MIEGTKVKFRDLSVALKIAIISSYIVGAIYLFYFIIGFIIGVSE